MLAQVLLGLIILIDPTSVLCFSCQINPTIPEGLLSKIIVTLVTRYNTMCTIIKHHLSMTSKFGEIFVDLKAAIQWGRWKLLAETQKISGMLPMSFFLVHYLSYRLNLSINCMSTNLQTNGGRHWSLNWRLFSGKFDIFFLFECLPQKTSISSSLKIYYSLQSRIAW